MQIPGFSAPLLSLLLVTFGFPVLSGKVAEKKLPEAPQSNAVLFHDSLDPQARTIDATSGVVVAPFVLRADYVEIPEGDDATGAVLVFPVVCTGNATATFKAEIIDPDDTDDFNYFTLQLDDGSQLDWNTSVSSSWFWSATSPSVSMTTGFHTVRIYGHEDGIKIRALRFERGMSGAGCEWQQVIHASSDKSNLLKEAVGTAYDSLNALMLNAEVKTSEFESQDQKPIAIHVGREGSQTAQMSENDLKVFLGKLSQTCRVQFEEMLEGKGAAKDLHFFGTSSKHMDADGCKKIGGAICENHAQVKQQVKTSDGRRLTTDSDVDGDSCLPKSCIQDPNLQMLSSFIQKHAVQSLGAASQGQQAPEVLLDVDCSQSGGSSYSATGSWSLEAGGAGKLHSMASRQWSQGCVLVALFLTLTAQVIVA